MPFRSSLARSLQYAMANMADIKTPLCALQPTPAIPHTASRSGAGTRGGARARTGAGPERASRQPPAPAGRVGRAWLLAAPALRGPEAAGLGEWPGRSEAGAAARRRSLPHTLTVSRSLPPGALEDRQRGRQLSAPARVSERPRREPHGAVLPAGVAAPAPAFLPPRAARGAGAAGRERRPGHGRARRRRYRRALGL